MDRIVELNLDDIILPDTNIRENVTEEGFTQLVESIKAFGLIEPLVVVERDGKYKLLAGMRRYLACREAGLFQALAVVKEIDPEEEELLTIEENLTREDVTSIEEARYFKKILQKKGWSIKTLAAKLKRSEDYIYERLKLLEADEKIQKAVEMRLLSFSSAKEIARIPDTNVRDYIYDLAVRTNASVEQVKEWKRSIEQDNTVKPVPAIEGNVEATTRGNLGGTFVCPVCRREYPYSQSVNLTLCGACYVELSDQLKAYWKENEKQ